MKKALTLAALLALVAVLLITPLALSHEEGDDTPAGEPHINETAKPAGPAICDFENGCAAENGNGAANATLLYFNYGLGGTWALITTLLIYFAFTGKKKKPNAKALGINIAIVSILAILAYFGGQYGGENIPVVVCAEGTCYMTMHIHSEITARVCGEAFAFGLETGELNESHTHKESGVVHWHDRLEVNPETQVPYDWGTLRLVNFFENLGLTFNSTTFDGYSNGDACPDGSPGVLKMTVNGIPNSEFGNYVWADGDVIQIEFGP
ncbi:MAG: hypothetical protein J4432_00110 [DPANN group archaeon]|nr:hypothetical protein [DPANN group archaeon]